MITIKCLANLILQKIKFYRYFPVKKSFWENARDITVVPFICGFCFPWFQYPVATVVWKQMILLLTCGPKGNSS